MITQTIQTILQISGIILAAVSIYQKWNEKRLAKYTASRKANKVYPKVLLPYKFTVQCAECTQKATQAKKINTTKIPGGSPTNN